MDLLPLEKSLGRMMSIFISSRQVIRRIQLMSQYQIGIYIFPAKCVGHVFIWIIGLTLITMCSFYKDSWQTYKGPEGETAVVDRVALSTDRNANLSITFMIRHTRRPEVTDFSLNFVILTIKCQGNVVLQVYFLCIISIRLVTNLVADMARKVFVVPLFNRKIFLSLNVGSALIWSWTLMDFQGRFYLNESSKVVSYDILVHRSPSRSWPDSTLFSGSIRQ